MNNLSFTLDLTENVDVNTLMLNAAVRINRLKSENAELRTKADSIQVVSFRISHVDKERIDTLTADEKREALLLAVEKKGA